MRGPVRSVLLAAFAIAGCMLEIGASTAAAAQILEAKGGNEGAEHFVPLRDNLTTPPSNGNYGADLAAINTAGNLAFTAGGANYNTTPKFDAFVGLKLSSNPESSTTTCRAATGYLEFADFQHSTRYDGANSPEYPGTLRPWRVTINSANTAGCTGGTARKVTIETVGLYFPTLATEVTGTIGGTYEQPGANCAAGGVRLNLSQPGLLLNGAGPPPELGFSNGAGGNAYLCFISSNNYVYPTVGYEAGLPTGSIATH